MQVPSSTPSAAIQFEFGVNDLTLEVLMEKIVLAVHTLNLCESRISRKILMSMLAKDVPGFCTELNEACNIFQVSLVDLKKENVREVLKRKVISMQAAELVKRMLLLSSKMEANKICIR